MSKLEKRKNGYRKPHPLPDPGSLAGTVEKYLEWMAVANYSERTIQNRRIHLGYFTRWCEERGLFKPAEVTKPVIERYQRYLFHYRKKNGEPLPPRTQRTRLVPIRTYFKWLARNNHIPFNPASEIDLPRREFRLPPHVLTASEAEAILGAPNVRDPLGLRDRAILETFYSTGMRRIELIGLSAYDLDIERGTVMIRHGKGNRDRIIPIGERAVKWIQKYLFEVRPSLVILPDDGILFLTARGEPFGEHRLTEIVGNYVAKSGTGKKGACHLFRHTMATLMLENGADIRYIQQMLGHAELSTTQIYTQVSIRKLKEIHTLTHPGNGHHQQSAIGGRQSGDGEEKLTPDNCPLSPVARA